MKMIGWGLASPGLRGKKERYIEEEWGKGRYALSHAFSLIIESVNKIYRKMMINKDIKEIPL